MISLLRGWLGWALGAAAAGAAVIVGVVVTRDAPEYGSEDMAPAVETTSETGMAPAATPEPAAEPAAEPEPEPPVLAAPHFDVVRISPEGSALIAGQAVAEAEVGVLVDGEEMVAVSSDADGNFVAMFELAPSDAPRILQLSLRLNGQETLSEETVIIEPRTVEMAAVELPEETPAAPSAPETGDAPDPSLAPADSVAGDTPVADAEPSVAEPDPTPELQEPRVLMADRDGITVMDAPSGDVPGLALDSIAYDEAGEVTVAGRAQPGTTIRGYLDNAAVGDAAVAEDGQWRLMLPETVEAGVYTLRIDQLGPDGVVMARVESPFKREDRAALVAAMGTTAEPTADTPTSDAPGEPAPDARQPLADAPVETAEAAPTDDPAPSEDVTDGQAEPAVTDTAEVETAEIDTAETEDAQAPSEEGTSEDTTPADVPSDAVELAETTPQDAAEPQVETPEPQPEPQPDPDAQPDPAISVVTVQPGSTLWAIARDQYGEPTLYVQVFEANRDKIRDPDMIYPGQVFNLPEINTGQ